MSTRNPSATLFPALGCTDACRSTLRTDSHLFPGCPDQVTRARDFVQQTLGSLPVVEEAVLLVSELATNAVLHTASGNGGDFQVAIYQSPGHVRIEVLDQGGEDTPTAQPTEPLTEVGRGISLVELVAARWGYTGDSAGRSVFFELTWKAD